MTHFPTAVLSKMRLPCSSVHVLHPNKLVHMADSATNEVSETVANLHLDEVTGERISKTELKKRQKLRAQEERKQQRAAATPAKTEKKRPAEDDESNLTPNVSDT